MKPVRVSISMPVYNCVRFIEATMESVMAQTYRDFEFIICDAVSNDGTLEILQKYAARDPRIKLFSQKDTGMVEALNRSIQIATGEYFARVDGDDPCHPERLAQQVKRLDEDPRLAVLGSCAVVIDPDGNELGEARQPLSHEEIEAHHLSGDQCIFHSAATMRTSALRQVGGYRNECQLVEELDLWLRLGEVGRVENHPGKLISWRRTTSGLVATTGAVRGRVLRQVMEDAWCRRGLPGQPVIPEVPVMSAVDMYRQWGWTALRHRHFRTARHYAFRSVVMEPFHGESWRLVCCALRGH